LESRFAGGGNREGNWDTLMDLLDEWAEIGSSEECDSILTAAGVPCSRYYTVEEALHLPPVKDRGILEPIQSDAGEMTVTNPAFQFGSCSAHARQHIPTLGGDGASIL